VTAKKMATEVMTTGLAIAAKISNVMIRFLGYQGKGQGENSKVELVSEGVGIS
jgi:hypothetical protein